MPAREILPLPNEESAQTYFPYVNNMHWDTNSQLLSSDVGGEGVISPNFHHNYNNTYETFSWFGQEMHDRVGLESGTGTLVPGSSLAPTQLPAPNQVDLTMAGGFEFVENSEAELYGNGEANLQTPWEGNEAVGVMDFSTVSPHMQHLTTASSSSGSGTQLAHHRRPRKKEESGAPDNIMTQTPKQIVPEPASLFLSSL
ncbi:hypothetical protein BJV77DRAFT_965721 [Russula vinacea]|nr:hypothetical protein BJV77DRAFT_965721 [Russula vinacea]